jgi:small subunit ribosomal protein S3Ae
MLFYASFLQMGKKPIIKKKAAVKKKVKKWITVMAPKEFGNISLGEIYVEESENAIGRVIKLSLMSVGGDFRRQNTNLRFEVVGAQGNQASTRVIGCEIPVAHLKRLARKAKTKIDDSFLVECKDGVKIRFKPSIIMKGQCSRAIRTDVRKANTEEIAKIAKGIESDKFFQMILRNEIQRQMKAGLKKIFPCQGYNIKKAVLEK